MLRNRKPQRDASFDKLNGYLVYTPVLALPYSPTTATTVTLSGYGVIAAMVTGDVVTASDSRVLSPVATAANGHFTLADLALLHGDNRFTLRLVDSAGNRSKSTTVTVTAATSPSRPTGLAGSAVGMTVNLNWAPNPEPDVVGYRLWRDGTPVLAEQPLTGLTVNVSGNTFLAPYIIDSDTSTSWYHEGVPEAWIALSWAAPRQVSQVQVRWQNLSNRARDFALEAWSGHHWVLLAAIRDNQDITDAILLPQAYRTTQLRLVWPQEVDTEAPQVAEFGGVHIPLLTGTAYAESRPDGWYTYALTAVNTYGFESLWSDTVAVAVGDVIAPEPVRVTAVVNTSSVALTWTASPASDVHHYEVYRDGVLIAQVTTLSALQYIDVGLANGTYTYTVVAVDHVGNRSEVSNRVTITIAIPPPAAPRHLTVVDTGTGGTLRLAWEIAPSEQPAGFRVLRSDHSGGPYTLVGETVAQTWLDTGLHNGSTYYYVVLALDTLGNASALSPEAHAIPHDRSAPDAPVLHFPTVAGQVWVSRAPQATVIGMAEPGARIQLMVNDQQIAMTQAQSTLQVLEKVLPDTYLHALSPDGRYVAYLSYQDDVLRLYDYTADAVLEVTAVAGTNYLRWAPDSASLLFSDFSRTSGHTLIRQYVLAGKRLTALTAPATTNITAATLSPDGTSLVVSGSIGEDSGLWLQDVATGTSHQLVTTSFAWEIQGTSLQWPPDGTSIAYLRGEETCEIVHVPTGSIQSIANVDPASVPQWAPDGQSLLYVSRSPAEQIRQYVLSTATTQDLATGLAPQWRRDGQGIVYVDPATTALLHTELATATTTTLLPGTRLLPATLQGVSYGWIGIFSQEPLGAETYHRLSLAGRFAVPDVRLEVGDNSITATARDTDGNSSAASPHLVLTYEPGEQADLTLTEDSIIVLPTTPRMGERTRVTVIVHNRGTLAAPATTASLVAMAPDSVASVLLDGVPVPPLAVGNSHALTADWTVPAQAGQYTLVAVVDPDNTVTESQESNNVVLKAVLVPSGALPAVAVRTAAPVYYSHDTVTATILMTNAGAPWSGRLVMTVTDTAGFLVQTLRQEEITALPYGANLEMIATWQVGTTFAGTYQIVARLLDLQGSVVASASAPFRIAETATMTTSVSSDRLVYTANTQVRVNGTVAYTVGNHVLSGVVARLRIRHASGALLAEQTTIMGDLVPGSTATVRLDWNTAVYAVGAYQLHLDVTQDGQLLSQATGQFTIVSSGPQLSGRLSLSAMTPTFGDTQTVTYTVTNHGNVALVQQPLRLSLVDVLSGLTLHEQHIPVDVAVSQHITGAVDIATTSLAVQSYTVLLHAVVDNGSGGTTLRPLASQTFSVMDRSAPVVAIIAPTHHGFSNGSGAVTMTAQDALSEVARVEFQIDGGPWQLAILQDAATGRYSAALPQLSDGFYIVQARATDAFNNAGLSAVVGFTVDITPPVITIQGVEDNTVYQSVPYTYEVEATDTDGDTLRYALSSAPAGMTIDAATGHLAWWPQQPGTYTVTVQASDPHGASDTQTYTVTVTVPNEMPAITSTPGTEAVVQQPYTYGVEALDPNGDPLAYSLDAAPAGMHIDTVSGVVTWQPETAGEVVVSLRVTDPYGASTTQQYTLRVSATP